jgi:hypothetical protein
LELPRRILTFISSFLGVRIPNRKARTVGLASCLRRVEVDVAADGRSAGGFSPLLFAVASGLMAWGFYTLVAGSAST